MGEPPPGRVRTEPVPKEAEEGGAVLACARCRRPVTSRAAGIEVDGGHEHSFLNPVGLRFHIGCFARAACLPSGEPSTHWTWFPGYSWQVELCPGCGEQLGWLFRRTVHQFHGLILDRLVEIET
jgi:hypothetical protein